jgi:hypothetical protein
MFSLDQLSSPLSAFTWYSLIHTQHEKFSRTGNEASNIEYLHSFFMVSWYLSVGFTCVGPLLWPTEIDIPFVNRWHSNLKPATQYNSPLATSTFKHISACAKDTNRFCADLETKYTWTLLWKRSFERESHPVTLRSFSYEHLLIKAQKSGFLLLAAYYVSSRLSGLEARQLGCIDSVNKIDNQHRSHRHR